MKLQTQIEIALAGVLFFGALLWTGVDRPASIFDGLAAGLIAGYLACRLGLLARRPD